MKLITKAIEQAFAKQGYTGEKSAKDIKIVCKFFNPMGAGTWYVYEREDSDILWAYVNLGDIHCAECGTVSLSELQSIRLPLGMSIERDINFPVLKYSLQEVIDRVQSGGHI